MCVCVISNDAEPNAFRLEKPSKHFNSFQSPNLLFSKPPPQNPSKHLQNPNARNPQNPPRPGNPTEKKKQKKQQQKKQKNPGLKTQKRALHTKKAQYTINTQENDQINQKRRLPRPEADPSHVSDSEISTDNNENKSKKA